MVSRSVTVVFQNLPCICCLRNNSGTFSQAPTQISTIRVGTAGVLVWLHFGHFGVPAVESRLSTLPISLNAWKDGGDYGRLMK